MQSLHIADSISVAPYLRGETCLDAVLACRGFHWLFSSLERHFTLLDTGKKDPIYTASGAGVGFEERYGDSDTGGKLAACWAF